MTNKELDNLLGKQDIKLSHSFNEALFAQIKDNAGDIDAMFAKDKLRLNNSFNDKVVDEARIDSFFAADKVELSDSFVDGVFAKLEEQKAPSLFSMAKILSAITALGGVAALFVAGVFLSKAPLVEESELIAEGSVIYEIAEDNIHSEIDYFLLEADMDKLSDEIDRLSASIIELESSGYTVSAANI